MSPPSNLVDGKDHVPSPWMDRRVLPVTPNSFGTTECGHSPVPCTIFQLANAPTNRETYDSFGDFTGDSGTTENTTTPKTQRESKEKQKATETPTRHIPVSRLWSGNSNSKRTTQPSDKKRRM